MTRVRCILEVTEEILSGDLRQKSGLKFRLMSIGSTITFFLVKIRIMKRWLSINIHICILYVFRHIPLYKTELHDTSATFQKVKKKVHFHVLFSLASEYIFYR